MKKLLLTSTCAAAFFLGTIFPQTASAGPGERHPEIHAAIHALESAVRHLREADHDFGGHREAAIQASETAIQQLRLALEAAPR